MAVQYKAGQIDGMVDDFVIKMIHTRTMLIYYMHELL